jgi:phosphate ABC transporter phosphate-binding protein
MKLQRSAESKIAARHIIRGWLPLLAVFCIVALHPHPAQTQASHSLQNIRTIYVATPTGGDAVKAVRSRLIDRLKKSGTVHIVDTASGADAVLQTTSVIWPTGSVSVNPRSNSTVLTNYQGYLSAELIDSAHQTLWSYLVTPGHFRMSNIVDDLADHLSARLIETIRTGMPGAATPSTAAAPDQHAGASLHAAGATFPAPLYTKWFQSFAQDQGGFPITYSAIGSVAGIEQLVDGKVDIAASDIPAKENQSTAQARFLHFPTVIGGVVPIYNLPGAGRTLNLTPQILADIYAGKIRKWNDQRIRQSNSGTRLPNEDISVIHRSDGSGTTWAWTSFLATASPEWKTRIGAGIEWPTGSGAEGNEGVAEAVAKAPNSIGYVELIYAIQHQLSYAAVQNPSGRFIRASLDSITAAAADAKNPSHELGFSVLNAPDRNAYPVTTFTWLLVPQEGSNSAQRTAIASFLRWMLTTGQKECSSLGYAPLPREVVTQELHSVGELK